ncbi:MULTISPECIES: cell division protein FtsQ/DivIB [unclassified Acinetobacter]|uniref:cell division protein FtsQ/DivIB n=1 Tax=unclassified Acinetobacter TaxID=196816 RepID=UPI00293508E3|nr:MULTISPECIES: cell division protein FtsQ/DivIB [unclassified Acinetobacter]WOE30959.1 cell division protein FtsQ/DivIB [Acinetobacter sp. SAAs470]WOE39155.1 cell division protein FtsQ/DivIB [Acinetobacter sp. SAAs474]
MAQLPTSIRRKKAAVTSIHEKPPTRAEKWANMGGWLLLLVAIVILAMGLFGLYRVMTDAKIANLEVVGGQSAQEREKVEKYVAPMIKHNYFTSDLKQIRDKTLELPWVDSVVVSRSWPNSIRIRIVPKHAIARWGTGRLLSDNGDIFSEVIAKNNQQLPLLHGPIRQAKTMMRRYNEINQLFLPVNLRLKELYLTDRMTWFMQFDSGLRVIVDQEQMMSKLQRLSYLAQNDLKPVWNQIAAIDLRYRNGMAIQWKNATAPKIINGRFVVTLSDPAVANLATVQP